MHFHDRPDNFSRWCVVKRKLPPWTRLGSSLGVDGGLTELRMKVAVFSRSGRNDERAVLLHHFLHESIVGANVYGQA